MKKSNRAYLVQVFMFIMGIVAFCKATSCDHPVQEIWLVIMTVWFAGGFVIMALKPATPSRGEPR